MWTLLTDIVRHRELLLVLAGRNLKIRYKSSALGFFWSLLAPIFMIVIYATFLGVMKFSIPLPYLVTGIIAWQFLSMCLGDSVHAVVGNANLVTKAAFPRIILPMSMALANLVNFLLSFAVLLVYLAIAGVQFGALWWLPAIIVTQFALCMGVACFLSCANVFFRDTEHILQMVMLAWFFMTPIIYPTALVMEPGRFPSWLQSLFYVNPMTGVVTAYRQVLISEAGPGRPFLMLSFAVAWAVLLLGTVVFQGFQDRFGDEL